MYSVTCVLSSLPKSNYTHDLIVLYAYENRSTALVFGKKGKFQTHCLNMSWFQANRLNVIVFINDIATNPLFTDSLWISLFVIFHSMMWFKARRLKKTNIHAYTHVRIHIDIHSYKIYTYTRASFACNFYIERLIHLRWRKFTSNASPIPSENHSTKYIWLVFHLGIQVIQFFPSSSPFNHAMLFVYVCNDDSRLNLYQSKWDGMKMSACTTYVLVYVVHVHKYVDTAAVAAVATPHSYSYITCIYKNTTFQTEGK